jgi:exodeoxyribonuclease VII small subunit
MGKKDPTFEQLFNELEATVQKLEAGNLTLDESLALYESGMRLAKRCNEQLDRAELRIQELGPPGGSPPGPGAEVVLEDEEEGD